MAINNITLSIDINDQNEMVKVSEVLSRALIGLAMDDIEGMIYTSKDTYEEED